MWQLAKIYNAAGSNLWFSDGKGLFAMRGGTSLSTRLVVSDQGFIDFTHTGPSHATDNNHAVQPQRCSCVDLNSRPVTISVFPPSHVRIYLVLPGDGTFLFSLDGKNFTSGSLKPLPRVSTTDIEYFQKMIDHGPVPYPYLGFEGKTQEEIRALGLRYFPFSPHSFQLAMALYDWTTASFARMVIMKMFEYTEIPENPPPLDKSSVASAIFDSNWLSFTPDNPDYMRSFLMTPAHSKQEVLTQLDAVLPQLQYFSAVENRLLAAAAISMPRTLKITTPQLYSGQLDMRQLGLDQFGIQFMQCPLNAGPPNLPLRFELDKALGTFLRPGKVITTKQVWSFSDSWDIAMNYQNGIVLVVQPPDDGSLVWETPCYVTPLSCEANKTEWIFPLGTNFTVLSSERWQKDELSLLVITLKQNTASAQTSVAKFSCKTTSSKFRLTPPFSKSNILLSDDVKACDIKITKCRAWFWSNMALIAILIVILLCGLRCLC